MSRLAAGALSEELDRRSKVDALHSYLRELDIELGPVSEDEQAAAREWAEQALDDPRQSMSSDVSRMA